MKGGNRYGAGRPAKHASIGSVSRVTVRDVPRSDPACTSVELSYRYPFADGVRDVCQRIAVEWTPCRFGGFRAWFRCPHCARRCASIYLHGWPACRTCARLVYPSTRCDPIDRSWRRTWAIEKRMGWKDFAPRGKPKGMHAATFERLCADYRREENLREALLCAFMASMAVRVPGFRL